MKRQSDSQIPTTTDPKPHHPSSSNVISSHPSRSTSSSGENDRFSNANLLSMLARSQSSRSQSRLGNTGTSSSSRTATGQISTGSKDSSRRRRDEKEVVRDNSSVVSQRSSTGSHRHTRELCEKISNSVTSYQLGTEIGRGGFAIVYQGFNVETGDFVAVKRFPLTAIDDESLGSIQAEIELMQRLKHPNIVKYIDTIRTADHLHIVLEYIENGSLSYVLRKFGSFSESLVAIYVAQILRGLAYLHGQGVLHRDIKGANILTTKDGHVKLADFGVAFKVNVNQAAKVAERGEDVVGSPYWIAPEIVEMSTPTEKCDIWSVGATIVELLTGKPPYFDMAPMAALFHIVQDDYPPLPDGISQALHDFLLLCFQKEPSMRSTALALLEHPWLLQQSMLQSSRGSPITSSPSRPARATRNSSSASMAATRGSPHRPSSSTRTGTEAGAGSAADTESGNPGSVRVDPLALQRENVSPTRSIKDDEVGSIDLDEGKSAQGNDATSSSSLKGDVNNDSATRRPNPSSTANATSLADPSVLTVTVPDSAATAAAVAAAGSPVLESPVSSEGSDATTVANVSTTTTPTAANNSRNSPPAARIAIESPSSVHNTGALTSPMSGSHNPPAAAALAAMSVPDLRLQLPSLLSSAAVESSSSSSLSLLPPSPLALNSKDENDLVPDEWESCHTSSSDSDNGLEVDTLSSSKLLLQMQQRHHYRLPPNYLSALAEAGGGINDGTKLTTTASSMQQQALAGGLRRRPMQQPSPTSSTMAALPRGGQGLMPLPPHDHRLSGRGGATSHLRANDSGISQSQMLLQRYMEDPDESEGYDSHWLEEGLLASNHSKATRARAPEDAMAMAMADSNLNHRAKEEDASSSPGGAVKPKDVDQQSQHGSIILEGGLSDLEGHNLAEELRGRMKMSTLAAASICDGSGFDDFVKSQFDDEDFERTDNKELDMRRTKEVLRVMAKIRRGSSEADISGACEKLMDTFSMFPDVADHLIRHFGVTPILDMFDAVCCTGGVSMTSSSSSSSSSSSTSSTHTVASVSAGQASSMGQGSSSGGSSVHCVSSVATADVLKVINKIMESNGWSQEQLVSMGIIPGVVRILEEESSNILTAMQGGAVKAAGKGTAKRQGQSTPPGSSSSGSSGPEDVERSSNNNNNNLKRPSIPQTPKLSLASISLSLKPSASPSSPSVPSSSSSSSSAPSSSATADNVLAITTAPSSSPFSLASLFPPSMMLTAAHANPQQPSSADDHPDPSPAAVGPNVDAAALEAARFVHLVTSASALSLQMLIGAGGLAALVHMISFCYLLTPLIEDGGKVPSPGTSSSSSITKSGSAGCSSSAAEGPSVAVESFFSSLTSLASSVIVAPAAIASPGETKAAGDQSSPANSDTTTGTSTLGKTESITTVADDHHHHNNSNSSSGQSVVEEGGGGGSPHSKGLDSGNSTPNSMSSAEASSVATEKHHHPQHAVAARPSLRQVVPQLLSSSVPGGVLPLSGAPPTSLLTDEVKLMMYMGIDCVLEVFSLHSAPCTRDFCRLFQKMGLLKHISVAFQRIFELQRANHVGCGAPTSLYKQRMAGSSAAASRAGSTSGASVQSYGLSSVQQQTQVSGNNNVNHGESCSTHRGGGGGGGVGTGLTKSLGTLPSSGSGSTMKGHRRKISDSSDFSFTGRAEIASLLASECTLECRYLHCIANVFLKFSRSEAAVAVGMAREPEVMHAIMVVLQLPALRVGGGSGSGSGSDNAAVASGSGGGKLLPGHGRGVACGNVPAIPADSSSSSSEARVGWGASSPPRTGTSSIANHGLDVAATEASGARPPVPPPPAPPNSRRTGEYDSMNSTPHTRDSSQRKSMTTNSLLAAAAALPPSCALGLVETLLKCLKNLSLESQALTYLESFGAIPMLIPLLNSTAAASFQNYILPTLFNLCRINKRRQEQAALNGCIPLLQSIIKTDSHLKQFALPIICDLAHASDVTRAELKKHGGGATFYIDLLQENYWQSFAMNSLTVWLTNDKSYMEPLILQPDSLTSLVNFFRTATPQSIRMLHKPFLDMMTKSEEFCRALANSGLFVSSLAKRLNSSDAIVLRSLLKMLQLLHQHHPNQRQFVLDNDLYNVVRGFAQSEGQVLVHQISNKLLVDFQSTTLT